MNISKVKLYERMIVLLFISLCVALYFQFRNTDKDLVTGVFSGGFVANIISTSTSFTNPFFSENTLEETGSMDEKPDSKWWLNSGGRMIRTDVGAQTIQGELLPADKWRIAYAHANPMDTDTGSHPQNLLRLVSKSSWQNMEQQVYFFIHNYNMSTSTNRNESNGVLLFNHYMDSNNLYYTGVRVDGLAIIKKKINGVYYTLVSKPIYGTVARPYDRVSNPNMLPVGEWVGIKSIVTNVSDGTVHIQLYIDRTGMGTWELVLETVDDGLKYGKPIRDGHVGIRSDFMDVSFKKYIVK